MSVNAFRHLLRVASSTADGVPELDELDELELAVLAALLDCVWTPDADDGVAADDPVAVGCVPDAAPVGGDSTTSRRPSDPSTFLVMNFHTPKSFSSNLGTSASYRSIDPYTSLGPLWLIT